LEYGHFTDSITVLCKDLSAAAVAAAANIDS